jgi:two-component system response regulator RegX3
MKKTALVIEDEESIREYMCWLLQDIGFQTVEADNGTDGLKQFAKGKFDLIITDMVMAGHSGDEIVKTIRKADPAVPLIAVSGALSHKDLVVGAGTGTDAVIQKPFTEDESIPV